MFENFHPFRDMKENAKAQHEADKANFEAAKLEAKATWEEAKLSPKARQEKMREELKQQTAEAIERIAAAQQRIDEAKKARK